MKIDSADKMNLRNDGWYNVFTNLGMPGKDKRLGANIVPHVLPQPILEALYQADDMAARIIDILPEEALREGFKIVIPNNDTDIPKQTMTYWQRLLMMKKVEQGLKWARLYGGAALLLGLNDGLDPEEPVQLEKIKSVDYVTVLDKFRIFPSAVINYDVTSQNFGFPDFYRVYTMQTTLPMIHHSRIIRLDGVSVPWRLRAHFNYWGDSIFGRLYKVIRDFQATHDAAALIVQDFTQFIYKLKNLNQMLAQGSSGDKLIAQRLALLDQTKSMVNSIVIQDGEEAERKSITVNGLADIIRLINNRVVAATGIPHTKLLGESPSGLGASGESEKTDWYDTVRSYQMSLVHPVLMRLLEITFSAKNGPTKGQVPEDFGIEFNTLWQQDEKEAAEIKNLQAQTDNYYIGNATLQPEEVAESRFGTGQYSTETQLDHKLRNQIEVSIAKGEAGIQWPPPDKGAKADPANMRDPSTYIAEPAPELSKKKTK